jgi:hypothetical protein
MGEGPMRGTKNAYLDNMTLEQIMSSRENPGNI